MLRGLLVGLLVANLLFWAWTQGALTSLTGQNPQGDREPQRVAEQRHPERIHVLPPGSLEKTAPRPQCMEAGPFTQADLAKVESAARAALPDGSWLLIRREKPGSWMTYMGPYNNRSFLQRKADELRKQSVAFEEVESSSSYAPGFAFGRYGRYDDALEALRRLQAQKVRPVRVVQIAPPSVSYTVRVPKADGAAQATAVQLKDPFGGKGFGNCRDNW